MEKLSKRMKKAGEVIDREKVYPIEEALEMLGKFPEVKFDETVEMHFHLNIDTKASDQSVRSTVVLPHGTGKDIKIAVFCKGELEQKAKDAGADFVGAEELIDKVSKGFLGFDVVIASPDMMRDLSKLGRILGPRGLMPTPKAGTVTADVAKAIKEVKAGKVEFKADKQAGIHVGVGKKSFPKEKIMENIRHLVEAIRNTKPTSVKGSLIKNMSITTTMGPGIKVSV